VPLFLKASTDMTPQWFAVRVRSRCEKVVAVAARSKAFEDFVPLHRRRQHWSDRSKWVDVPLFPGYLFCRLNPEDRFSLLTIRGVMHIVGVGRVPEPVNEQEILAIQHAVRSDAPVEPWPFLERGPRVRLSSGPLVGLEGILVNTEAELRVVVGLSVLKRSVAVRVEPDWVESAVPAAVSAAS
jgi:transcription antitermination factor NusG